MRRRGCVISELNGTFTAKFELSSVNGKRKQKKKRGFCTEDEADKWINSELDQVKRGTYFEPTKQKLVDYSRQWMERKAHTIKGSTWRNYESYLHAHVNPCLGNLKLPDIQLPNLLNLIAIMSKKTHRGQPLRAKTIKNVMRMLHDILGDAVRDRLIHGNPARDLKPSDYPKSKKYSPELPTLEEIRESLQATELQDRVIFMLDIMTGLRRAEICGLQWSDIDWLNGRVKVQRAIVLMKSTDGVRRFVWGIGTPKSERSLRDVPLRDRVLRVLQRWKQESPKDIPWVFSKEGSFIPPDHFTKFIAGPLIRRVTKGRVRGLHSFRHAISTILQEHRIPLKAVQEILGHADPLTTSGFYTHPTDDGKRQAIQILEGVIFGGLEKRFGTSSVPHPKREEEKGPIN